MSHELLREARERYAATTKGEWAATACAIYTNSTPTGRSRIGVVCTPQGQSAEPSERDAAWIAFAHNNFPALLDLAESGERLRERLERVQQACDIFEKNSADATEVWEKNRKQASRIAELEAQIRDLRDALRLRIGMDRHRPWHTVAEADVDGWLEHFRQVKGDAK